MRAIIAATLLVTLAAAPDARAETRLFIVANNADGYGVDRCLATGARCGTLVANAYCQSNDYKQAVSFRKVDGAEITGSTPAAASGSACTGACADYVAIECQR